MRCSESLAALIASQVVKTQARYEDAHSIRSLFVTERAQDEAMPAIFDRILPLNVVANTAIFYLAARLYLWPQLPRLRPKQILIPILLLHSTRHLGMMFLTRGATYPGLPAEFAYPAAFGDLVTAILALLAIPLVLRGSRAAKPAMWIFNVFGTVDLLVAIVTATIYNAPVAMGPAYWIPAFWVPLLLVTHYVTFVVLLRRGEF
jgi:hypothetical protein